MARELCAIPTGVVHPGNREVFARIAPLLPAPLRIIPFPSGSRFNGWEVPNSWQATRVLIEREGRVVYDGTGHPLAAAAYSRPFAGELAWEELLPHLVSDPGRPEATVFHCMWQYRPWDRDWAIALPHAVREKLGPGRYRVELATREAPGEMLVGVCDLPGELQETIVLNTHTCHPCQANDAMAAVVLLVRLFNWLAERPRRYSYRLVLGPEHLGTVFYLASLSHPEISRLVGAIFAEMPGVAAPLKRAATFLGGHPLEAALDNAALAVGAGLVPVPWRQGVGNDETVWESPGWEVPCVELTRFDGQVLHYREYHSDLDTVASLDPARVEEFYRVLATAIATLEDNLVATRRFEGIICLSNPDYRLYQERPDPAVAKNLAKDSEKWGYLVDCVLRYFDGCMTSLEVLRR